MNESDINRWAALIQERPEGPWEMGCGGSFDRTKINPISDAMMEELAQYLKNGYTPWNGRSMPLSGRDREYMFLLYYCAQGLVSRVRQAERLAQPVSGEPVGTVMTAPIGEAEWTIIKWADGATCPPPGTKLYADGLPPTNARCKFASGGSICVSHCGDASCLRQILPPDIEGYANGGPLLHLDTLLAALSAAIYEPCNDAHNDDPDGCLPAQDILAIPECKAIQAHVRDMLTTGYEFAPEDAEFEIREIVDGEEEPYAMAAGPRASALAEARVYAANCPEAAIYEVIKRRIA